MSPRKRQLIITVISGVPKKKGEGEFTVMPVSEANFLGANDASADEDGNDEEDGDTDHLDSDVRCEHVDGSKEHTQNARSDYTHKDSQNSISPYAKMPAILNPRNTNQNINIHAHCGTTSVQYVITSEIALYSFASTVTQRYQ